MADDLLCALILASEKASRIARLCRENRSLFSLLIQEKGEKNNEIDFKTLADVFIQQMVIKEMKLKFGKLANHVQGEENNQFTNTLGETVAVDIGTDATETAGMLAKVLDGNEDAARILAEAAHETISLDFSQFVSEKTLQEIRASDLNLNRVGIWIDPIDCTSQYVEGIEDSQPIKRGIFESGLQCVMVLIGVYCLDTGKPVMGIVNQPFHRNTDSDKRKWVGRMVWGYCHNGPMKNNLPSTVTNTNEPTHEKPAVVLSLHDPEAQKIMAGLLTPVDICLSRGAGYKCATVFDHLAEAFLYTYDGSFKWDTCGPHAVLRSFGGGISVLHDAVARMGKSRPTTQGLLEVLDSCQVKYNVPDGISPILKANAGGLLVYSETQGSLDTAEKILMAFAKERS